MVVILVLPGVFYNDIAILVTAAIITFFILSRKTEKAVAHCFQTIHPNKYKILSASATQLASCIRKGTFTAEYCCQVFIERQKMVNPILNAVVAQRYRFALKEAKRVDEKLTTLRIQFPNEDELKKHIPPYYGVPCSIKECFAVVGMPNTSGAKQRVGIEAENDAIAVQRMTNAGFIVLSVTNTSELCMWWESRNNVYGTTNNPYDVSRTVGGSSGGEGAIIAALGAPIGLGSDIGGSIRLPAFFTGVFGHKPSAKLVPNHGQYPCADGDAQYLLCSGPMCRKAEDLWPLLEILAGPHENDSFCEAFGLHNKPTDVVLSSVNVFYSLGGVGPSFIVPSADNEMNSAVLNVAKYLESKVKRVQGKDFDGFRFGLPIWSSMIDSGSEISFQDRLSEGNAHFNIVKELAKYFVGRSHHTFPALGLCVIERFANFPSVSKKFIREGEILRAEIEDALSDNGVLIFLSQPRCAPKHGYPLYPSHLCSFAYTAIFNALGLPVTQVPIGLSKDGLPVGVQVVGARGMDHLCIAIAIELEKGFGGWKIPTNVN